jgi:D-sedoheptulose 7-phosphate isomerase
MTEMPQFHRRVIDVIEESIAVKQLVLDSSEIVATISDVSKLLIEALTKGNKAFFFGNGGSAADAQHIAAEFVGRFAFDRRALPALALSVNSSCVTAIGNDYGFDQVFSRQIEALGRAGDVAVGITTSGNSRNVILGLRAAKRAGMHAIVFTGGLGGDIKSVADYHICVPSNLTPRIQECHILIGHIIAELVEETMFPECSDLQSSSRMR